MKKQFFTALAAILGVICPGAIQAWEADVTIHNDTQYYLTVTGKGPGNTGDAVAPGQSYSWSSTETYNTKDLLFWEQAGVGQPFMQGSCAFGPTAGVYVDRGWMETQSLCMVAQANQASDTQCTNGGTTLLQWNEFEEGGDITLTFESKKRASQRSR